MKRGLVIVGDVKDGPIRTVTTIPTKTENANELNGFFFLLYIWEDEESKQFWKRQV